MTLTAQHEIVDTLSDEASSNDKCHDLAERTILTKRGDRDLGAVVDVESTTLSIQHSHTADGGLS